MIKIYTKKLNVNDALNKFSFSSLKVGAEVNFIGYVRDFSQERFDVKELWIEYYDGMTQKVLMEIESIARSKWNLIDVVICHRAGKVRIGDPIVLVSVFSSHRDDAFEACRFIIDSLKVNAPLWKKEVSNNQSFWVEQEESDLVKVK